MIKATPLICRGLPIKFWLPNVWQSEKGQAPLSPGWVSCQIEFWGGQNLVVHSPSLIHFLCGMWHPAGDSCTTKIKIILVSKPLCKFFCCFWNDLSNLNSIYANFSSFWKHHLTRRSHLRVATATPQAHHFSGQWQSLNKTFSNSSAKRPHWFVFATFKHPRHSSRLAF